MRLRYILPVGLLVCILLFLSHRRAAPDYSNHDAPALVATTEFDQPVTVAFPIPASATATGLDHRLPAQPNRLTPAAPRANKYHGQPLGTVITDLVAPPADWREFNPESINLRLPDGSTATYQRLSFKSTSTHNLWFGYDETSKGWLSATASEHSWNAELMTPGKLSHRIYAASNAVVTSADPTTMICADIVDHALREAAAGQEQRFLANRQAATQTELSNVNIASIAVLYDQDTENDVTLLLNAAGSSDSAETAIRNSVLASLEYCNVFLNISEVGNLAWELAAVGKMQAYDRTGQTTMDRDLDSISTTQSNAGIYARQFFTTHSADQGVLIVGGEREEDGLGETPGNYSVVAWYRNQYLAFLFAHEMAHNLGCRHDRASYNDPLGNGLYNYGHTYDLDYDSDGTVESFGTIMSYGGDYLSPYFSNPDVDDEGVPTGVALDRPDAANNALKLREQAAAITGFRIHQDDAAITTQPAANAVTLGQTLTLNVTATGPNLSYQWYKDSQILAGATTATYTKSNVTQSDAGSYVVAVTNPRRTAVSNPANVTTTSSPPPSTSGGSSSGGGGGGGGGAPSYWFFAALSLLGLRRLMRQS